MRCLSTDQHYTNGGTLLHTLMRSSTVHISALINEAIENV